MSDKIKWPEPDPKPPKESEFHYIGPENPRQFKCGKCDRLHPSIYAAKYCCVTHAEHDANELLQRWVNAWQTYLIVANHWDAGKLLGDTITFLEKQKSKKPAVKEIIINGIHYDATGPAGWNSISYEGLIEFLGYKPGTIFSVTFRYANDEFPAGVLTPGTSAAVRAGMIINVANTRGA